LALIHRFELLFIGVKSERFPRIPRENGTFCCWSERISILVIRRKAGKKDWHGMGRKRKERKTKK
jgi:hypothetical protein